MRGVTTEVDKDNDTALVEVSDESARSGLIEKLLDAAGDEPRQIKVLTGGNHPAYRVPLALAKKAGLVHRAAPQKAAPKKAASKADTDSKTEDDNSSAAADEQSGD